MRLGYHPKLLLNAPPAPTLPTGDDFHHAVHPHTLSTTLPSTLKCQVAQLQAVLPEWILYE
jgi:hypothetical protein